MEKKNAPSCERNQEPILNVLKKLISEEAPTILEIGSGTGQHAAFMAQALPQVKWITSDVSSNHTAIKQWTEGIKNIEGPQKYEVGKDNFPKKKIHYCFTSNTFHIMPWKLVKSLIKAFGLGLQDGAQVIIYGPFNYDGKYTSPSNEKFDKWLKERDIKSGIRNFEDIKAAMEKNSLQFSQDIEMPSNNRILVFTKIKLQTN